jgi:hypothetical protein
MKYHKLCDDHPELKEIPELIDKERKLFDEISELESTLEHL